LAAQTVGAPFTGAAVKYRSHKGCGCKTMSFHGIYAIFNSHTISENNQGLIDVEKGAKQGII